MIFIQEKLIMYANNQDKHEKLESICGGGNNIDLILHTLKLEKFTTIITYLPQISFMSRVLVPRPIHHLDIGLVSYTHASRMEWNS